MTVERRSESAQRAEGAEQPILNVNPPDPRDDLDRYLRHLESAEHYEPIRETCGEDQ